MHRRRNVAVSLFLGVTCAVAAVLGSSASRVRASDASARAIPTITFNLGVKVEGHGKYNRHDTAGGDITGEITYHYQGAFLLTDIPEYGPFERTVEAVFVGGWDDEWTLGPVKCFNKADRVESDSAKLTLKRGRFGEVTIRLGGSFAGGEGAAGVSKRCSAGVLDISPVLTPKNLFLSDQFLERAESREQPILVKLGSALPNHSKVYEKIDDSGVSKKTYGNVTVTDTVSNTAALWLEPPPCVGTITAQVGKGLKINGKPPAPTSITIDGKPATAYEATVKEGDTVSTGRGQVELGFGQGTETVRLGPNSEVKVTRAHCKQQEGKEISSEVALRLEIGNLWAKLAHAVGGDKDPCEGGGPGFFFTYILVADCSHETGGGVRGSTLEASYSPAQKRLRIRTDEDVSWIWGFVGGVRKSVRIPSGDCSDVVRGKAPTAPRRCAPFFRWGGR